MDAAAGFPPSLALRSRKKQKEGVQGLGAGSDAALPITLIFMLFAY